MSASVLRAYVDATERCAAQCVDMLSCEQEKRKALLGGSTEELEKALQRQQADIMALDALEKKRVSTQEAAGFSPEATAREILSTLPDCPERDELADAVARLRTHADELRDLNRTALEIAGNELQFNAALRGSALTGGPATYKPGQAKTAGRNTGASFEQTI